MNVIWAGYMVFDLLILVFEPVFSLDTHAGIESHVSQKPLNPPLQRVLTLSQCHYD